MARALTAGELTKLRSDTQHSRLYLVVHPATPVFRAELSSPPSSDDEVAEISYTSGAFETGYSQTVADMIVYIGTTDEAYDLGMVRLREAVSGASGTMKIGEISEIDWSLATYLTVVDEIALAPRHIRLDSGGTVYMDYDVTYSDQHQYWRPVPCLRPDAIVWLEDRSALMKPIGDDPAVSNVIGPATYLIGDPATASAFGDADFDGSDSWVIGDTIGAYAWTAPEASLVTDPATSTPVVTVSNAKKAFRVQCVLTSNSGSKTATGHRYVYPVMTTGDNKPITEFTLDGCSGNFEDGGWSFQVTLYAEAARDDIRDRAKVILFAQDWYGGTEGSIGPIADREDVIAIGWISGETINWDKENGSVSFEVHGPQHWLNQMSGFPMAIEDTGSTPTAWTEVQSLTLQKALVSFAHYRATMSALMDIFITDDSRRLALFNAGGQLSLWQQLTSESQATILAHPACDRYGRLYCYVNQQLLPTGDRGSIPTIHTILHQDLRRPITFQRVVLDPVGLVDLSGVYYSAPDTASPLFSLAPGHVPEWHGPSIEAITELALTSQNQANTLAGLYLSWRNNKYPSVPLLLASNHRMFDIVPHQYGVLSIASGDTVREIVWSSKNLVIRGVSLEHDPSTGQLLANIETEAETTGYGVPTQDGDIPSSPPDAASPPSPPPYWDPEPSIDYGTGEVVGVAGDGGFFYTEDALTSTPSFTKFTTGIGDDSWIRALCNDPKVPYRAACIDNNETVYVTTNWRGGSSWTSALTLAEAETLIEAKISGSISDLELVDVKAFGKATDETGTLLVVAQFDWDETGGENASEIMKTRVLRSTDWGSTWACGGEIPGQTYLSFLFKSWTYNPKYNGSGTYTNHGEGELAFDGTNIILCARTMKDNSLAKSGSNYSVDWGETWQNTPFLDYGGAGDVAYGVTAAECDSTGKLWAVWWKTAAGANGSDVVTSVDQGDTLVVVKDLTDTWDYADKRGSFAILYGDHWAVLEISVTGNTTIEVNGSDGDTLVGVAYRMIRGFQRDADIIYIGRSYINAEQAGVGDTDLFRVSQDRGTNFSADGSNLYALGLRGVSGIISDWSSD